MALLMPFAVTSPLLRDGEVPFIRYNPMQPSPAKQRAVVLAEFGATMYICQMFESSLCFLHALIFEDQNPGSFNVSRDFHSENTRSTMRV